MTITLCNAASGGENAGRTIVQKAKERVNANPFGIQNS